ncbi:hypothetical protein ACQKWADRAFT_308000 [Trichoderma austrokoningii]
MSTSISTSITTPTSEPSENTILICTMHPHPFRAPSPTNGLTEMWDEVVGPDMQGHDILFGKYRDQFNTFRIPILSYRDYRDKARRLARRAKNKEEFERLFEEENNKKLKDSIDFMYKTYGTMLHDSERFPCKDAKNTALWACSGALDAFMYLLKGTCFGWEADEESIYLGSWILAEDAMAVATKQHTTPNSNATGSKDVQVDASRSGGRTTCDCGSTELLSCVSCSRKMDDCRNCHPNLAICRRCDQENVPRHYDSTDDEEDIDTDVQEHLQALKSAISKRQAATDDKDHNRANKRRRLEDSFIPEPTSINHSSTPTPATGQSTSRKRPGCDDRDDNHGSNKRQRLEGSFMPEPTSINHYSPSSPAADRRQSRKRVRDYDDDHDDNNNPRQKRQKMEASAASTATSLASSSMKQVANKEVVKTEGSRHHRQSSQKRRKSSRISKRSQPASTRSAKRKAQSTLWELGSLGKPRSI